MSVAFIRYIWKYFTEGHQRSLNIKKNIVLTFAFKVPAILIDLLVLRLTLDYLGPVKFGIWITLVSVIAWMSFSDVGMASGLRNRVAEALARNEPERARTYISTTYMLMSGISILIIVLFASVNTFIQWDWVLNSPSEMNAELSKLAFWVVFFSALYYSAGLIKAVVKATQVTFAAAAIDLLASLMIFGAVWLLLETTSGSLFLLGFWHSMLLALSPLLVSFAFFGFFKPDLRPSLKYVDRNSISHIWGLGLKFLIIQICSIVIFSTDNIIIAQALGPESVTAYAITFKFFHILTLGFAMISVPFWSAFTDAFAKGEIDWIRRIRRKQLWLLIPLSVAAIVFALIGRFVIEKIWLDRVLGIDFLLLSLMAIYVMLQAWNRVFAYFLNGVGSLKVTLFTMSVGAVVNIPVSIFLARDLGLGSAGVILGTIISLSLFGVLAPMQTLSILSKKR
ncbi:MATE family efflux transporter [bacterium]|nr:MATE family efflux transporter [bacterium]